MIRTLRQGSARSTAVVLAVVLLLPLITPMRVLMLSNDDHGHTDVGADSEVTGPPSDPGSSHDFVTHHEPDPGRAHHHVERSRHMERSRHVERSRHHHDGGGHHVAVSRHEQPSHRHDGTQLVDHDHQWSDLDPSLDLSPRSTRAAFTRPIRALSAALEPVVSSLERSRPAMARPCEAPPPRRRCTKTIVLIV